VHTLRKGDDDDDDDDDDDNMLPQTQCIYGGFLLSLSQLLPFIRCKINKHTFFITNIQSSTFIQTRRREIT
jgi:hypothetical protein